jgi:hypothetical protein
VYAFEPNVVRTPTVVVLSLIAVGTPYSGPACSGRGNAASAVARAASAVTVTKAPSPSAYVSMRAR